MTITSPLSGTTVEGIVTVAARVNDDHKVARVSLTVDGAEVDSSEPAGGTGVTASLTWDSNAAADGAQAHGLGQHEAQNLEIREPERLQHGQLARAFADR